MKTVLSVCIPSDIIGLMADGINIQIDDPAIARALENRAARNGRTISEEVRSLLEENLLPLSNEQLAGAAQRIAAMTPPVSQTPVDELIHQGRDER